MIKLIEFEGDEIRLTPEGVKLADDLHAGRVNVDEFFDRAIQNMIDQGLLERVGEDGFQITPKGAHIYHALRHTHDDELCPVCGLRKRKDCGPNGWLKASAFPCPNKEPS
jgi:hypothetical protein